jgi:hypothetical protein
MGIQAKPGRFAQILALGCSVLVTWVPLFPAPAYATGRSDRARATALKRRADGEMESLRYADALKDYSASYEITHDPAILYDRARVLQALERFPDAVVELDKFTHAASPELKARVPQLAKLHEELESHVARLSIDCTVADARVLVRQQVVATTPVTEPIVLNAGHAVLEVVAQGYLTFHREIDLPGGGTRAVHVVLSPLEQNGQIHVASTPDGSDVFVDGKPAGRTPVDVHVSAGSHELRVTHDGYRDETRSALVVEDEHKDLSITLRENPPISQKWWFWTGIGVVGVAVGAIVAAQFIDRSASSGTLGKESAPY